MSGLPELGLWLAAGLVLGAAYLALLGRSVAALAGPAPMAPAALWLLLRVALAAGGFWAAASQGALPLLVMLAGFLIARSVAIRRAREAGDGR